MADEQRSAAQKFEDLAKRLLAVPKTKLDEAEKKRVKRPRRKSQP